MIDMFKLTATSIRRILKICVYLPEDYNKNTDKYPIVLLFNGHLYFKFFDEDRKVTDLNEYLANNKANFIVAGIFGPQNNYPEWEISELNQYYSGSLENVDSSYSSPFYDYIAYQLLPILKMKYRIIDDEIYLMGIDRGAIPAISMIYSYKDFKGAMLLSPNLNDCNNKIFDDIKTNFNDDKKVYLYQGELNTSDKDGDLFYTLQSTLEKQNISYMVLDYDMNSGNTTLDIINHLENAFKIIK